MCLNILQSPEASRCAQVTPKFDTSIIQVGQLAIKTHWYNENHHGNLLPKNLQDWMVAIQSFNLLFFYHLIAGENNCTRWLDPKMNPGDGNKNREEGYESRFPMTKISLLFVFLFLAWINTISAIIRDLDLGY